MSTRAPLLRTRTSVAWLGLTLATILSWLLGGHGVPGVSNSHALTGVSILLIAIVKIRFVALYFMELRAAPAALRAMFECYCGVVFAALTFLYLHT